MRCVHSFTPLLRQHVEAACRLSGDQRRAAATAWFTGGAPLRGDWRPTLTAVGLLALFAGICALPLGRHLFELSTMTTWEWAVVCGAAVAWALLVRLVWRSGLVGRLLHVG